MLQLLLLVVVYAVAQAAPPPASQPAASRPADIAFSVRMIDPGFSESVAIADVNRDGRLDILSAEHWYEAPAWTRHRIRDIPFNGSYIDNFSDLPVDVDGDGYVDLVQIAYFARRIVWLKNPGKSRGPWMETEVDAIGPTEFAFLVDLNNDGKAAEILPQFTGAGKAPLAWYELQSGRWVKHVVSAQSRGHGIGAGDVNGDGRTDIVTPAGWFEAPADVRAPAEWAFHPADWMAPPPPPSSSAAAPPVQMFRPLTRDEAIKEGFAVEYAPGKFDLRNGARLFPNGLFQAPIAAPGPSATQPPARPAEYGFMHVLDINKDGLNDILTTMAHSYGVLWFEQRPGGQWVRQIIDATWANAHASALADLNGDGQPDLVTAKRYFGRTGADPAEREPMGVYWYQFRPGPQGSVQWVRHIIDYGGRAGAGLQMMAEDIDGDGDRDVVMAGKTGLFLAENLMRSRTTRRTDGR